MQAPARAILLSDPGNASVPADGSSDAADEGWYWQPGECAPRNEMPYDEMVAQWHHLVDVLTRHDVEVVTLNQASGMLLTGQMTGPMLSGRIVHPEGYGGLLWMLVSLSVFAAITLIVAVRFAARHSNE